MLPFRRGSPALRSGALPPTLALPSLIRHRHKSLAILILAAAFQGPQGTTRIIFHPNCQEDFSGMESCRAQQVRAVTQGL